VPQGKEKPLLATRTPILNSGSAEEKRAEILKYYQDTWELYEKLFETLKGEEPWTARPEPLRHPLIFYYAHTATFFINKLSVTKLLDKRVDPKMESMMAIGVDEMSWDDLDDAHYDWPAVEEVQAYRNKVRSIVEDKIRTMPLTMPIGWDDPFWIILMGIEHERIHLETSSVLIRQLPIDQVRPHPYWQPCSESGPAPENTLVDVAAGRVVIGKDRDHALYGWDNEYGRSETDVAAFQTGRYLVSNGEFLEFVRDGGYKREELWTEEGWSWRNYRSKGRPVFWVTDGEGGFRYRTMLEEIDMPLDWPVDVNYLEAKAFCNWKTEKTGKQYRLPTEAEWYRMAARVDTDQPYWDEAPGNINLEYCASSCPVDRFDNGGLFDVIGNAWQWTETPIDAFQGFEVHPAYDDFSVPTFDTRHNMIKGGSWISTGNEATRASRYAFRRHFFQHAGFRYVQSDTPLEEAVNVYETEELISQYLEFHYGETFFGVENFPKACIAAAMETIGDGPRGKALDIGCSVGRSSFELARHFDQVEATDFSTRFIGSAIELQNSGLRRYAIRDEGDLMTFKEANLADLGLEETAARVEFFQGDACNLKELYTGYDLVFAGNLIDRLYDPAMFLKLIAGRIRPGGHLVLTSPYTWLEEYTERENWLGGYKEDGENVTTLDGLHRNLDRSFDRVGEPRGVEFVIRETKRKFQHSVAEMTVWRRKG
jgi:5-histidylcysteine sulfoxide synthase/putative 4-mercaptohistidine N1-methyltranferase